MNRYEFVGILKVGELEDKSDLKRRLNQEIKILKFEELGVKRLAYDVKGEKRGDYILFEYNAKECQENKILGIFKELNIDIIKHIEVLEYKEEVKGTIDDRLYEILDLWSECEWGNEPLDSDEVDKLCDLLKLKLNYINGNITYEEYLKG